ncbi:MAG: phenylacetate-CoA oxygenase subunit PaaJ [Chitinophagaceae bacterium]|nr:phenylacetate-CoA oxygenase subunit PaaJ [Chitinophagaceae bacterium]
MILKKNISPKQIWEMLAQITDPEIPVLSIVDLGIVRDVKLFPSPLVEKGQGVEVIITPTYSGCPAMDVISMNIRMELMQKGFANIKITQQLSPAWTTDWMTENGKAQLKAYGIAPPQTRSDGPPSDRISKLLFSDEVIVECPQCHSKNTKLLSQFGSTACKALYQCQDCQEPFDYFKCH